MWTEENKMKRTVLINCVLLFCWSATAQNLLVNGEFDNDITGWSAFTTISWVSDEGAPISGDGSMMNMHTSNNNASFPAIADRFMVKPHYSYLTGVSFNVPAASPVPWAWYRIFWYDAMDNPIGESNTVSAVFGVPNDVWVDLDGMSQAPANAATGELRIYFQTGEPGEADPPFGLWDDVFVIEDTIFLNGFD